MTESKITVTKQAKQLLALNPEQDSEFKKKVQEAKKKKNVNAVRRHDLVLRVAIPSAQFNFVVARGSSLDTFSYNVFCRRRTV